MSTTTATAESTCASFVPHYREVLGVLARRSGNVDTAADVLQEAFLRLLQRPAQTATVEQPRAFLHRVAGRLLVDHHRRERSRGTVAERPPESVPAHGKCPQCAIEDQERLQQARSALADLPPRCREVFLLHRIEGLSYRAIAERLDIAPSTVEKHIIRALAACRRSIDRAERI